MGKSILPYSQVVDLVEGFFTPYRRCMTKEDKARFDRLFNFARRHTPGGVVLSDPDPFRPIVLAMLLEILALLEKREDERANRPCARHGDPV